MSARRGLTIPGLAGGLPLAQAATGPASAPQNNDDVQTAALHDRLVNDGCAPEHLEGCGGAKLESFEREGATVTRCVNCGAQLVENGAEPPLPRPPWDEGVEFSRAPEPVHHIVVDQNGRGLWQ